MEAQPFHIHVDALSLDSAFEQHLCKNLHFYRVDYSIDPHSVDLEENSSGHSYHLTFKTRSSLDFKRVFKELQEFVKEKNPIERGYIEGEFIPFSKKFEERPFREISIPFRLHMKPPETGNFRESEIHVTLSRDESDPRLLDALHNNMNLLSGYIPKSWGIAQIFTIQGTRAQIDELREPLWNFLHKTGGAVRGSMKEERTAGYWMSHPDKIGLPHVISRIEYNSTNIYLFTGGIHLHA